MSDPFYKRTLPLYRARDGWIFGVCQGVANLTNLSVFWIRVGVVVTFFLTGFFPIVFLYLLAALLMKPEPVIAPESASDWEFYNSYATSRTLALDRLRRKFDRLERRARRLENLVTTREFDWEQRLNEGR